MTKVFMCDIITHDEEHTYMEQLLIKASSPTDAFEKLVHTRHYANMKIYDQERLDYLLILM